MRKNKMMRAASALLVAVLLTTSTISGTFAKYVTTNSAKDEARVAKWGVELQVVGNLFGDSYTNVENGNKITADNDANVTVQSYNVSTGADDVVAPGTKNEEGFTFSLKGQPEVDGIVEVYIKTKNVFLAKGTYGVMIPVDETILNAENFDEFEGLYYADGDNYKEAESYDSSKKYYTLENPAVVDGEDSVSYWPIKYTTVGGFNTANVTAGGTVAVDNSMKSLVYNTVGISGAGLTIARGYPSNNTTTGITEFKYSKTFNSNDNLADVINIDDIKITWEWAFEGQNDAADTILGMLMANDVDPDNDVDDFIVVKLGTDGTTYTSGLEKYKDYSVDVMFDISITVTQVD